MIHDIISLRNEISGYLLTKIWLRISSKHLSFAKYLKFQGRLTLAILSNYPIFCAFAAVKFTECTSHSNKQISCSFNEIDQKWFGILGDSVQFCILLFKRRRRVSSVVEHSSAYPKVPGSNPGPVSYRGHGLWWGMIHASYSWSGPQLPKGCGCIGFLSSRHKKIPDSYSKREGGNPGNSRLSSQQ